MCKDIFNNIGEKWSGRQDSNLRHPPWKGGALPTELRPHSIGAWLDGGERRIRTFEGINRQIYSLLPLAARQSLLIKLSLKIDGADYRNRTYDRRFTKPMLYQLS